MSDIVVCIMVKNEEEALCKTLEPLFNDFTNFFIYDTGSTDNTVKVVSDFLMDNNKNFVVKVENFTNFADSRNRSLDLSRDLFPECKFTLSLDCEWYIVNPKGIIDFCNSLIEPYSQSYFVYIQSNTFFKQHRLFVNSQNARYKGVVHEYVESNGNMSVPPTTYFNYAPTKGGNERTNARWFRDLGLLLSEYNKNKDPRTVFYLAQTYDCLVDVDNAFKYYKERAEMTNGYEEERFMARYRAGKLFKDTNPNLAFKFLMLSYNDRPSRVEPLVQICEIFDDYNIKYMFSKIACSIPETTDGLFVEKEAYDYVRWEQYYLSCYVLGKYKEGYPILLKIKDLIGDTLKVKNNLFYFESKINKENTVVQQHNIRILLLISQSDNNNLNIELLNYYNSKNIDFYFYGNDPQNEGIFERFIYFKGEKNYLLSKNNSLGLTQRTLKVFKIFEQQLDQYDYVVRSDTSSIINIDLLKFCLRRPIDYGGPLYYVSSGINNNSGMTPEKHCIYGNYGFPSGICTVFSPKTVQYLLNYSEEIELLNFTDDLSISIFIKLNSCENKLIDTKIDADVKFDCKEFNSNTLVYYNPSINLIRDLKKFKYNKIINGFIVE